MSRTWKDKGWRPKPEYWSSRPHSFKCDKKLTRKTERQKARVDVGTIGGVDDGLSKVARFVSKQVSKP